jgi:hypothetical protein
MTSDSQVPEKGRWITIGDELLPDPLRVRRGWRGEIEFMGIGKTGSYPLPTGLLEGLDLTDRSLFWVNMAVVNDVWHMFRATATIDASDVLHVEVDDLGPEQPVPAPAWWLRDMGGQGARIYECVICGADDYLDALVHKDGCEEIRERVARLRGMS